MNAFYSKSYLGLLSVSFIALNIQLFAISKQASVWNRCLRKRSETLSKVKAVKKMNDDSKEVLSVMICNGVVFEPNLRRITNKLSAFISRIFDIQLFLRSYVLWFLV